MLVVEDADSPTPAPIVHALVLRPAADATASLAEGALKGPGGEGRNSRPGQEYLPQESLSAARSAAGRGRAPVRLSGVCARPDPWVGRGRWAEGAVKDALKGTRACPRLHCSGRTNASEVPRAASARSAQISKLSAADRGTCSRTSARVRPSKRVSSWVCTSVIKIRTGHVRSSGQVQRSRRACGEAQGRGVSGPSSARITSPTVISVDRPAPTGSRRRPHVC